VSFQNLNQYPEIQALAEGIVDLSCRDSEGNQFIIEMESGKVSGHIRTLTLSV
jgi:RecB family endonuclease NucS